MPNNAAVVQSLMFHGFVAGLFVVSAPYLSRDIAPEQAILTVEIVNVVPETNLDEGADVAEPEIQQEEPAASKVTPATPPTPPPEKVTEQEDSPSPKADDAEALPETADVKKEDKPKSPPKAVTTPPQRPLIKSPVYKKAKDAQLALASKLQDLTERKAAQRVDEEDVESQEEDDAEVKLADRAGQALNTRPKNTSLTGISVADKLRNHIAEHWSPPPGAAGADALIVDIIVSLNAQAEVQKVAIVDKARFRSDDTFKAAANAARRAIFDASPLPLPLDQYEQWKELQIKFDPRFITRR
jgi:outer membrane biosynthesis protein TonB